MTKNRKIEMRDFFDAVAAGDLDSVRAQMSAGKLSASSDTGLTPLMVAARHDQPEMVAELLALGANPAIFDAQGYTAPMHAVLTGSVRALQAFIDRGAIARLKEADELHVSALRERFDMLLESPKAEIRHFSALIDEGLPLKAGGGSDSLMRKLQLITFDDWAPMALSIMKLLVERGYPPDDGLVSSGPDAKNAVTPIFRAIEHGDYPLFLTLIERGANARAKHISRIESNGNVTFEDTGLLGAVIRAGNSADMLRYCLKHFRGTMTANTLWQVFLGSNRADISAPILCASAPLKDWSVKYSPDESPDNVIGLGLTDVLTMASCDRRDHREAMLIAILNSDAGAVKCVIQKEHLVKLAEKGCHRLVPALLDHGYDASVRDRRGRTPLLALVDACLKQERRAGEVDEERAIVIAQSLLKRGVDLRAQKKLTQRLEALKLSTPSLAATIESAMLANGKRKRPGSALSLGL